MQLRSLIEGLDLLKVEGNLSVEANGLAYEARRLAQGDVYVALELDDADGHREIELAIERGAIAVVCRKNGAMRQKATVIEVADTRVALADLAAKFYDQPGDELRIIGVTGHSGAWKTALLLAEILRQNGVKTGLISSLRHEIGERKLPSAFPLESLDFQRLFAEMVRAGCRMCVLHLPEISLSATRGVPLDLLVLAGADQNVWRLSEFLRHSKSRRPASGVVKLEKQNGSEAACAMLFAMHLTFGFSSAAQVSLQDVRYTAESTEGTLYIGNESCRIELPLIGGENLSHLLAASAGALACRLTAKQIASALREISTPPGSLEAVPGPANFSVFVDDARDSKSLESALRSLREITRGRILLVFGASEKTCGKDRFSMGRIAAKYAQYIILTSDNPGRESVEQICSVLAQGIESASESSYHFQPNRAEAIEELFGMARQGDMLLIAGKGDRTYQELANTIVPFDDRTVARECFAILAAPRLPTERHDLLHA